MQRGIITISRAELSAAHELLAQHNPSTALLLSKFDPDTLSPGAQTVRVELSREEAERILDLLPLPIAGAESNYNQLRAHLQTLLTSFT